MQTGSEGSLSHKGPGLLRITPLLKLLGLSLRLSAHHALPEVSLTSDLALGTWKTHSLATVIMLLLCLPCAERKAGIRPL